MSHRVLATLLVLAVPMFVMPMAVAGQRNPGALETWSPPQTPWGHPDLQGTWSNTTKTPLERPAGLAGKESLTDEEWAEWDQRQKTSERPSLPMPTGAYNSFWLEQGVLSGRPSLIVDPRAARG